MDGYKRNQVLLNYFIKLNMKLNVAFIIGAFALSSVAAQVVDDSQMVEATTANTTISSASMNGTASGVKKGKKTTKKAKLSIGGKATKKQDSTGILPAPSSQIEDVIDYFPPSSTGPVV